MSDGRAARALSVAAALLCSSCLVGPDYRPPQPATLPSAWAFLAGSGLAQGGQVEQRWWRLFRDPLLEDLVARAIRGNTDIDVAVARVRAARASRREAFASLFPSLDATVDYQRRRPSGTTFSPTSSREFDNWSAGFDSTWEIDLFGGIRRSNEQAIAALEAAGADLRDALVSVVAEVARNYVELRSLQSRIAIAVSNARSQEETLAIARWRFDAGLVSALDVEQAEYNLASTLARIPTLESERSAAANRLGVLLGLGAGSLDHELARAAPVPSAPASVTIGMPVELLRRRPDVVAAERRLAAATAAIGVARAELYPRLTLSGTFGIAATDFADLGSPGARGFSVGPAIRWNIFDAGRLRSIVERRSAEADEALARWEAAVLAAYEEAANAVVAYDREQRRRDRLEEARAAAREAHGLARLQYENGLVDFQQVLEAQRALLGFEESFAISEAAVTSNLVALYKSLGGGWEALACDDDVCREDAPAEAETAPQQLR